MLEFHHYFHFYLIPSKLASG